MQNNSLLSHLKKLLRDTHFSPADAVALVAAAFACASFSAVLGGDFTTLIFTRQISAPLFWGVLAAALLLFCACFLWLRTVKFIRWCVLLSCLSYALLLVSTLSGDIYFNLGVAAVLLVMLKYAAKDSLGLPVLSRRASLAVTTATFLLFSTFVSICTVVKYYSFGQGTFDFGIFCQMFEQMAKTGVPYTTVERSQLLSHFAVHFSPIFYVLLPGYIIFRSPVYLLVAQAVVVGLGVFPIRRICRSLGMGETAAAGAAVLYALFPTVANGCFYDFHENKFLSVLLLYMIAFVLEQKRIPAAVFALLTLCVKEDAFIYVLAVAVWMLLAKRDRRFAAVLIVASILWFVFACAMIRLSGGEIMSDRFANYSEEGGLFGAVRTCFYNIGYLIREVFAGADTERFAELTYPGQKLEFVLWLCVPLLFTPFAGKHSTQLVLLIPLLVVNLMPAWMYQFNIDYQYTYGTAALVLVSALLTVSGWSGGARRFFFCGALMLALVFSVSAVGPKAARNLDRYYPNREAYAATAQVLRQIPADASVTAYGYMMPHLAYVDDLHACPDYYAPLEKTDYYVIDLRYDYDNHTGKMFAAMGDDYTVLAEDGFAQIWQRNDSVKH